MVITELEDNWTATADRCLQLQTTYSTQSNFIYCQTYHYCF